MFTVACVARITQQEFYVFTFSFNEQCSKNAIVGEI